MVDAFVDNALDQLDRLETSAETIVGYCADHGDFGCRTRLPEKAPGIGYGAITRVPFIWSWPSEFRSGRNRRRTRDCRSVPDDHVAVR